MWNKKNMSMMACQFIFGFSFYGVMVTLTPYFLEGLKYEESKTMMVIGAFSAVGTLFSIIGGFIGDKFIGAYRSLKISYFAFALGYALLLVGAMTMNLPMSTLGIALASYGRGLMSPNYAPLFKSTFDNEDVFENAYPINYSVNNVGAFAGQYIFPLLIPVFAFTGNFMLAGISTAIGFLILVVMGKPLTSTAQSIDKKAVSLKNWVIFAGLTIVMLGIVYFMFSYPDEGQYIVYAISAAAIAYFMFLTFTSQPSTRLRMGTIIIIVFLTTAFFVYYGQMMTSMTLVAIKMMDGKLFGLIPIAPEGSMVLNPLWCMVAGPVLTFMFTRLEKRNIFLSTTTKVGFAFILTTCAFAYLTFVLKTVGDDLTLSPENFLVVHFFQAFAEVIVGSLVVAFILKVAPKHIHGFGVSMFMVAMALSGIIGAVISKSIALEKGAELTHDVVVNTYGGFFQMLTIAAIALVFITFICSFIITKMLKAADNWDELHAKTTMVDKTSV
ncbi:MAG: MFS transporter [Gammaproteobacteria bacterium]|nr:MFS transporter [Gammaproteobacteria bacterium]